MKYRMRWYDAEWHNEAYTDYAKFTRALKRLMLAGFSVEVGRS
jgi:hypothetical protein